MPRGGWQRGQTHCKKGHALTPDNTDVEIRGRKTIRICRTCEKERSAKWYAKQTDERTYARVRRSNLQRYGMTPEEYDALLEAQNGVCAICKKPEKTKRGVLHVDHDHSTGKNRALLCSLCNPGLGCFQDSPELLEAAKVYLVRHMETVSI
jgi:hypothetical protein